jgi:hypothetical protein
MTREVKIINKIYCEGQREYYFIDSVLRVTDNIKKFKHTSKSGSHSAIIDNAINDYFIGDKICLIDNSNRAERQIPLLEDNKGLLKYAKEKEITLIISKVQFDDEIIDFFNIPKLSNKNSKESIDQYLNDKNMDWNSFVIKIIKDKQYIISNLDKIKNKDLKDLIRLFLDSYKGDNYENN